MSEGSRGHVSQMGSTQMEMESWIGLEINVTLQRLLHAAKVTSDLVCCSWMLIPT